MAALHRATLVLCPLVILLAPRVQAQQIISARIQGGDVVIEGESGTCSGDLRRGTANLFGTAFPIAASGITCPYTVSGDGALTGTEGGVYYYLTEPATGVVASNMAARFERHVDVAPLPDNTYFVSLPLIRSIPDVANTTGLGADKCVGDVGGPPTPDGIVTADDLLCSWWTSRSTGQGSMLVARWDVPTQAWQERSAFIDGAGLVEFSGTWIDPITDISEGYLASVDGAVGTQNRFLIGGAHDPRWPGRAIAAVPAGSHPFYLLSMPYNTMTSAASDILCGIGGAPPGPCNAGLFDGTHITGVEMRDSIADGGPADGEWLGRSVSYGPLSGIRCAGTNFQLPRGDAFYLYLHEKHAAANFLPPTW